MQKTPISSQDSLTNLTSHFGKTNCLPALFISHGAPSLATEQSTLTNTMHKIGQNLPLPKAILIMSAHWLTEGLEINSNPQPSTWHDFTGFDRKLYQLEYPAMGHPDFAETLYEQLTDRKVSCRLNPIRPFDHGVWSPLIHLYPQANIPIVQLSLPMSYDAYTCYQLGNLFTQLREEQVLIIGSGSITHNLKNIQWESKHIDTQAKSFKVWLLNQLKHNIPKALDWKSYDNINQIHPSDEHLLPLFFALGTGQRVSVVHESMAHYSLGMDILRFD